MDFTYDDHLTCIKNQARELARYISRFEDECETHGSLTTSSRADIKAAVLESGFVAMNAPTELGGRGMTWLEQVVVEEEFGWLSNGLWATIWRPTVALLLGHNSDQREKYLIPEIRGERFGGRAVTEPLAGSDPSLIRTTAQRDGNRFVINGEKWFVTLGDVADYFVLLATVVPDNKPTLFLVDKSLPGVECTETPEYTHRFAFAHPNFRFTNVVVPGSAVLGDIGQGAQLSGATFYEERILVGAHAVGAAQRALTLATDWARSRIQGGKPIIEHQMIQSMIADSVIDIAASRALLHQLACDLDRGGDPRTLNAKIAMTKVAITEAAGRVADRSVQMFGGRGYMRSNPVERIYRDMRVDRIWMGTSEVQRQIVSKEVQKRGLGGLLSFANSGNKDRQAAIV